MQTEETIAPKPSQFGKALIAASLFFLLQTGSVFSAVYYVATSGMDTNSGTIGSPFATIQRAQQAATAGDTVYIRGGTYLMSESQIATNVSIWAYVTYLDKNGTSAARINYWAYPGEKPVFDFSNVRPANLRVTAFFVKGSWLHFKGLDVTGIQVTITSHTQSICFENQGSNNIYELLTMHDGQAIGIYVTKGANNLILNCDAYRNWDYTSENGKGANVDGFGGHLSKGGTNNVFRGCRAWFNSDDGYDCINSAEMVTFDNCWAFYNGYSTNFASLGDGNGFKSGGYGSTPTNQLPNPIPRHVTRFCVAVRNKANGFYSNHHIGGSDWFNNTGYRNSVNYNMLCRLSNNVTDVPGYGHVMKNNLGYLGTTQVTNLNMTTNDVSYNYFTLGVVVSSNDFASLDESLLTQPRQANGDLPGIPFAHLVAGSDLIDAGINIGFPFNGTAPDLGAFEKPSPAAPRITSAVQQGNDMVITWKTEGGQTNAVQATPDLAASFADITGPIVLAGSGETTTNYEEPGGATNSPTRFYRVRLVP